MSVLSVQEIYEKYIVPPNLQKHMLRVAALSQIITENWRGSEIDGKSIQFACLFHDLANIIKFDLSKPSLFEEENAQNNYWKQIQLQFIKKYGIDEHKATIAIAKEIGVARPIIDLIANLQWHNIQKILDIQDFEIAITIYCDMRIGPYGILQLKDRVDNLKTRSKSTLFDFYKKAGSTLEDTLQSHIQVPLDSISDDQLNEKCAALLKSKLDVGY